MPDEDSYTDVVHAPVDKIIDTLNDFAAYPEWQGSVKECEVIDHDEDGLGRRVRMKIDAKIKKFDIVAIHTWEVPTAFYWELESGDLKEFSGRYDFEPRLDGDTDVTCRIVVDIGFSVPARMKKMIMQQAFKNALRGLKKRVETT